MDNKRLIELAIEGLQAKKEAIELEIQALSKGVRAAVSTFRRPSATKAAPAEKAAPKRKTRSAASRKAQAEKMRAYWAKRKAATVKKTSKGRKTTKPKAAKAAQPVPF